MAAWLLLTASMAQACDVCGIFLGIQPHDRVSSFSLLWRYRHLEGTITNPAQALAVPKHGDHGGGAPLQPGGNHYRELYQVVELRADLWLTDRIALLASLPAVNNYRAVNGFIGNDIYGVGDPLLIGRYMVANTRKLGEEERIAHRLMLGGGVKLPLGRNDVTYNDVAVGMDQQPGTGTWDALGTVEYMVRNGRNGGAVTLIGRLNGRDGTAHRMGHGLSSTAELFHRWDVKDNLKLMPSLGLYHELTGRDAIGDAFVQGTGSSTLFTHVGTRLWWRSWGFQAMFQYAIGHDLGDMMVPNRERVIIGMTYNLIKD